MNLPDVWELCVQFMWDKTYVHGLETFLRDRGAKRILDAAGGTGFPSIELFKRGWDITYAEGSPSMVEYFKKRIAQDTLSIPTVLSRWDELPKKTDGEFDAVLCRGNSLVYVDSWDAGTPKATTEERIRSALNAFAAVLKPSGTLYVDIFNANEFGKDHYPFVETFPSIKVRGKRIDMMWEVNHEPERRLRTVKITLNINGESEEYILHSYLLHHEELAQMMVEAGFLQVAKVKVAGENNYTVFVGTK